MHTDFHVIVIGGGTPGVHAARALAAGGLQVALVERERAGGAVRGVDRLRGTGRLAGPCAVEVDRVRYTTEHVVLATGAEPIIPPIRGLRGLEGVWTSREATAIKAVPRRLLVLGGGRTGVELGQAARRLGAEVVLVERAVRVLRHEPAPLGEALGAALRRDGMELVLGADVTAARRHGKDYVLALDDGRELRGDRLLVAAGRRPRVNGLGLVTLRMVPDARGIRVDARLRAGARLWAIGAVTGLPGVGEYQAGIVAANLLGDAREADYASVPRLISTDPQAAAVGATEDRFGATAHLAAGYLTLLSDGERLTGAHAVGSEAGAWLARVALGALADEIQPRSEIYLRALEALRREIATAQPPAEVAS